MQSTILVGLAMALTWFEMTGHISLANITFFSILGVWVWDLADRMSEADRKEVHRRESCNH